MSAITNKLEDAKKALENLKRKRRFKKANDARAEAAELQYSLAACRGKLEICQKDFNRTIRAEARHIQEGASVGADTTIQEQTLWDAAIGYMMVKDAIFSLRTISTFDSVTHAYDMLGTAIDLMSERERAKPKLPKLISKRERNVYGYITSNAALQQKQELLDSFFEELKRSGDIEACLMMARDPAALSAARKAGALDQSDTAAWDAVLGKRPEPKAMPELDDADFDALMDIEPPK